MNVFGRLLVFSLLIPAVACSSDSPSAPTTTSSAPYSQTDLVIGTGVAAVSTSTVTVAYAGWLYDSNKTDGKGAQFDASPNATFPLGSVIRGWQQGVAGMRVGGQRRLIIPPDLAYGAVGGAPVSRRMRHSSSIRPARRPIAPRRSVRDTSEASRCVSDFGGVSDTCRDVSDTWSDTGYRV